MNITFYINTVYYNDWEMLTKSFNILYDKPRIMTMNRFIIN